MFAGRLGGLNTKHVQRILNKMIPGNRCLAGSECSRAACVDERTELRAGGEDKSDEGVEPHCGGPGLGVWILLQIPWEEAR